VLARLDPAHGWRFIREALESDVADTQGGTTAEGIHLGAMAGTVDLVQRCLTGMRPGGEVLRFDPVLLPPEIRSVSFSVHHQEHRVAITLADDYLSLGPPGTLVRLRTGRWSLAPAGDGRDRESGPGRLAPQGRGSGRPDQ
jgi:trehalose/maltose hydrolase-like predicted phosphorylase